MKISEVFYSIQGEGPTIGIPSYFIRLGGCNLLCGGPGTKQDGKLHNGATWRCDTIEVWSNWSEWSFGDLIKALGDEFPDRIDRGAHIVITGGEPLMQQDHIIQFIDRVKELIGKRPYIEIETNGTIVPSPKLCARVDQWNVSPKLENSGMRERLRIVPNALNKLKRQPESYFKFVVSSQEDMAEIGWLIFTYKIPRSSVILMPAGETREDLLEADKICVELCKTGGYRYSPREHINIWDKKTGV